MFKNLRQKEVTKLFKDPVVDPLESTILDITSFKDAELLCGGYLRSRWLEFLETRSIKVVRNLVKKIIGFLSLYQ